MLGSLYRGVADRLELTVLRFVDVRQLLVVLDQATLVIVYWGHSLRLGADADCLCFWQGGLLYEGGLEVLEVAVGLVFFLGGVFIVGENFAEV